MLLRFLTFLTALLFLASCGWPGGSSSAPGGVGPSTGQRERQLASLGYTYLPLKKISRDSRYSGQFLVNGKPVDLLIDSGANSTDLDLDLANKLELRIDQTARVVSRGALGRPVTSQVGLGVLSAGPVSALPFPFMLAQETGPTATSRYDGQLGLDALQALGAMVDLRSGRFWVPGRNASNTQRERIVALGEQQGLGFNALRLRPVAKHLPHLVLESKWNGKLITWIVDTGAEVSVLSAESARLLGLQTTPSPARIIDASGDNAAVRSGVFQNVFFDRLILTEFEVAVTPLPVVRKNFRDQNGRMIDGIIGMDFLENTAALLDAGSQILYVGDPQQTLAQPAPAVAKRSIAGAVGLKW